MNTGLLTTARWHLLQHPSDFPWGEDITDELIDLIGNKLGFPAPSTPQETLIPIAPLPPKGTGHCIALVVGHARPVDEGNVGAGGVSEEEYNLPLVRKVAGRLEARGIKVIVITYIPANDYEPAMRWLAKHLLDNKATAAIEFHFNDFDGKAKGHEVLHWERSKRGITLAESVLESIDRKFPWHLSRGLKAKTSRDRGALFLSLTHCPACICEPFFGDNPAEWNQFDDFDEVERLADAYAEGIFAWIKANP